MRALFRETSSHPWTPLSLTGPPEFSDADPGGDYEATVPCEVSRDLRSRLYGAQLKVEGSSRPWFGRIEDVTDTGVHAWGWQTYLNDHMREACICETEVARWTDRTIVSTLRGSGITTAKNGTSISFCVGAGEDGSAAAIPSGAWAGEMLRVPPTTLLTVAPFDAWRPDTTHWRLRVRVGADDASGPESERITWSANIPWVANVGGGSTSYTDQTFSCAAVDFGLDHFDWVTVEATCMAGYTPTDSSCGFTIDQGIRACINAAGSAMVQPTASAIIRDSCDRLPASVLPAGAAYQQFITTDTSDLGRVVFDARSRESDKCAYVAQRRGYRWGWYGRIIDRSYVPVPVYEPHSTTPDYYCFADGVGVVANLTPPGFSTKAKVCRVFYHDNNGRELYTDVTDTDIDHVCVQRDIARYTSLTVDTTDVSVAITEGQRHLADINRTTAPGEVLIRRPIRTATGGVAMPCDIEAGKVLQVDGAADGTTIGRIVLAKHVGLASARLTLEKMPVSLATAVAKVAAAVAAPDSSAIHNMPRGRSRIRY